MKHSAAAQLPAGVIARLEAFVALLLRWNARINLVSRAGADAETVWARHVLDSAQLVPLLPELRGELLDLGTGGGFPGLILAIATPWHAHLVEADHRKATFLREAVRLTGATATVHAGRAEGLALPTCPVVTARALAPLATCLHLAAPLLGPGGVCLFLKGRTAESELTEARREWHMQVERFPSATSPDSVIFRLRGITRASIAG